MALWLVGGLAVLLMLVVIVLAVRSSASNSGATAATGATASTAYQNIPPEWIVRNELGKPDAPVVVEAWEDFRCPACGAFNQSIKPTLIDEYIVSGQVKLVFRHFPLQQHDPGATLAAQAAECAADQGMFWPYHDVLFSVQDQGAEAYTMSRLIGYAQDLGLDRDTFSQCMTGQKHLEAVQASRQEAIRQGHNATPTVLVNGRKLANPLDGQELFGAILEALQP